MSATTEIDQLRKQNAQLLRALMRVKAERDELLKQLAALQAEQPEQAVR